MSVYVFQEMALLMLLVYVTFPQDGCLRDASGSAAIQPRGLEAARLLARELVAARLAAGVNILPGVQSVYRWQGDIQEAEELVLLAQVSGAALADFCAHVRARHPHEVPCISALPITGGNAAFLRWIEENSRSVQPDDIHPQPI